MDVIANHVRFHAQILGEGGRPPLVMLHGLLLGSLASWYFTSAPELAKDRRVLLYDLRGHGKSERTAAGYDVRTMARDLAALVDTLGAPRVDLAGHSFGGLVALRFALDDPGRVRRLAVVEAPVPPSSFHELDGFAARSPEDMLEALPEGLRLFVAQGGRRAQRLLGSIRFLVAESSLLADLRAERDVPAEELARLDLPVLCAYGDRSSCLPAGERLCRAIPGARLAVLPGGHYLHLDATAQLTRRLVEHFDG